MTFLYNFIKVAAIPFVLCSVFPFTAHSVVAKPDVIHASQPDGSYVEIILSGDAFSRRAFSTDGFPLTTDADGFYVFADVDDQGNIVPTSIHASSPEDRSASESEAISRMDKDKIERAFSAMSSHKADVRKAASKRNPSTGNGDSRSVPLCSVRYPSAGAPKSLVILVEFSNNEFTVTNPVDFFSRMLNEKDFSDFGATGSVRDYFVSNSGGVFTPQFDVYGPVKLPKSIMYYGQNDYWGNDKRPHEMIIDACKLIDDKVDFSEYDFNGDGKIDNVYVFYAGFGEADGGSASTIWPHSYDISSATDEIFEFDGVMLNHYACSNELKNKTTIPDGIGTFTHEFSHVLGHPDLYATIASSAHTPEEWSILDVGSYNNDGRTPTSYSSFERFALGWLTPSILSESGEYSLPPLTESNQAFMIPTSNPDEYFFLENRQPVGNDLYLPGHGMLVWHIDFNQDIWDLNLANVDASHQYVDLLEAGGINAHARSGDPFPGTRKITELSASSFPPLLAWDETSPGPEIFDIKESPEGMISFSVKNNSLGSVTTLPAGHDMRIIIEGRALSCPEGEATAFDATGRTVAHIGSDPVPLSPGIYIIVCGSSRSKILIP